MTNKDMILYTATWCGPCQQLKNKLEKEDLLDSIEVIVIDDIVQELKSNIGLRSIPTLKYKGELINESSVIYNKILEITKGGC